MGLSEVYRPYLLARDESGVQVGLLEGIDSGDFLRGQMSGGGAERGDKIVGKCMNIRHRRFGFYVILVYNVLNIF